MDVKRQRWDLAMNLLLFEICDQNDASPTFHPQATEKSEIVGGDRLLQPGLNLINDDAEEEATAH
jgi:N-acyl-L-homoserine lactone synthetase